MQPSKDQKRLKSRRIMLSNLLTTRCLGPLSVRPLKIVAYAGRRLEAQLEAFLEENRWESVVRLGR